MHTSQLSKTSNHYISLEDLYGAHNYHPLPVVLSRGSGVYLWDVDGKKYFDFLSAYSAVNQGHCHPKITEALIQQAQKLALTSRAFYNDKLGTYEEFITHFFGFEKVLPMTSGAEAVETAIKICRKWGYEKKNIPDQEALIVVCEQNFHGRTTTIVSFSSDHESKNHFGPFPGGFISVPYDNISILEELFQKEGKRIAGFLVEPIQGEAGVYVPADDYLKQVAALCKEYNILFLADEIQTGIGRTGALLRVCGDCNCSAGCERQENTYSRPDILILGKALSGGVYPISAVLCDNDIMNVIHPGQHGSTFGGNPIAAHVAIKALEVIDEEKLTQNARRLGHIFRERIQRELVEKSNWVSQVRGKGLLNAIVINDSEESKTAWNLCLIMAENGLLAKPTHGNIIRFAPPLVITEDQLHECIDIIINSVLSYSVG